MSRGVWVRLVIVIGLLAGCTALALTREPRLGLDLRGGTQITLQAKDSARAKATAENTDRAIEVLRGRVDALGIAEPTLTRSGENRILVELPDVQDPREAVETLGRTAQLTMHPVLREVNSADVKPSKKGNEILPDSDQGGFLEVGPTEVDGDQVRSSDPQQDPTRGLDWTVSINFDREGGQAWQDMTGRAACFPFTDPKRRVAIVLDGTIISSPPVAEGVGCNVGIGGNSTEITGGFTLEEARNLAILIEGGALPLPVEVIERRTVGPTLGAEAIEDSWRAAVIGLVLTSLFIGAVYRLVGLIATLALTSYALLAYALLVGLGSTLTLPGLAGFVLAIGLAIDANVLVFERAREEYAAYPSAGLRRALMVGFNKAWSAIIDSNVTTLLAAALLFGLGSGPVKGFGVTLTIGVVASMVSALVIARVLTELAVSGRPVARRPQITGLATVGRVRTWLDARSPDLMARRRTWLGISAAALVIAVAGIVGGLNLGVEFTGGRVLEYSTAQRLPADEARAAVVDAGFSEATVQESDDDKISVRVGRITDDEAIEIEQAIAEAAGGATKERDEEIGASLGSELRQKALIAFGIALLVQMLYLAARFKWTFGVSAVVAMFHDVIIVLGIFAWLDRPIDGVFLAAALTIIGLSVNDTVVVFDRIRERWRGSRPDQGFSEMANRACIETMPRTVNTGLGAMFILATLAILGGDSLRDFSLALLLGLLIGTYSSVFTATPILTYLQQRAPMSRAEKVRRKARDPEDSGAVV